MQLILKPETLRLRIANRIRLSSELQDVLTTTVAELRSFLRSDRVKIYKFHPDQSGQVIAESVDSNKLPSLLGLNFPADDIPPEARELFINSRVRSIVNVDTQQIGRIPLCEDLEDEANFSEKDFYRPVDPCHVEYLTAMGVKSSVVVPIMHQKQLWGLLVSHDSESRLIPESELDVVQMVVDQLSLAIAQSTLITQAQEKATRETTIKRIATLLHSLPTIEYQSALAETIAAFGGSGGRLCMKNPVVMESFGNCLQLDNEHIKVYAYGKQPVIPEQAKYRHMEQYNVWQERYKSGKYHIWAISDVYKIPGLRTLQVAFRATKIRSILMIPLNYRQELLGYLSIFRDEVETKILWAGEFDPDGRQLYPRQSFEVWQESKAAQPREWSVEEVELARELGQQFAFAIHENEQSQQIRMLVTNASTQVQQDTTNLEQSIKQQQALSEVIAKIRTSLDIETIFQTTSKEVCQLLQADRVSVYRFNSDWGGEFVGDYEVSNPEWLHLSQLGVNTVWNDTYLQQTQGGRYRDNQTLAVDDIYQMKFEQCHIQLLEQFQIKAFAIAPIFVGEQLWGLLAAYQHSAPRHWESSDIHFLTQTATQLGVALQQAELLAKTKQQAVELQKAAEQQQLLLDVVTKIRASLELGTIFQTTTKELCQLLQADRVSVYRFNNDWSGEFVGSFEAANPEWSNLSKLGVNTVWHDTYLQETQGGRYRHNQTCVVDDIYQMEFTPCHLDILEQFQIKAFAIAPIFVGQKLWGLLAMYQHSAPRHWDSSDIKFLSQIAAQLGMALQQVELLAKTQQQAGDLRKALDDLQATGEQKQFLIRVVEKMRKSLTFSGYDHNIGENSSLK
ncbi:GAF domain-containing protein [Pelatocladus sp. BLCC-F211]|uniref:GAF domain-containing protein n=1 Tax=Pelatocladus sp. BLCC-F211 TaxID=3342752 RepID=UPI0035BAEAAE